MGRSRIALVVIAWILGAVAAQAQPAAAPPAAPDSTPLSGIVVEGRTAEAQKAYAAAVQTFVQKQGAPSFGHALERWDRKICPLTTGLSDEANDLVSQRIKDVAARVGAPSDGLCRGENIMVVFSDEPVELMARTRDQHAGLLGYHFVGQRKSLAAFQPPMKSWYETTTDGKKDAVYTADGSYARQPACIDLLADDISCKILPPLHSRFAFAFIVIDADWAKSRPIGAVADAAAMLALTRPGPRGGCGALPSALDLLESGCPASGSTSGLTAYDEAFLKGLYEFNTGKYAAQTTELAITERAAIAKRIMQDAEPPQTH